MIVTAMNSGNTPTSSSTSNPTSSETSSSCISSSTRRNEPQSAEATEQACRARYDHDQANWEPVTFMAIAAAYKLESFLQYVHRTVNLYFDAHSLFHDYQKDFNEVAKKNLPDSASHLLLLLVEEIELAIQDIRNRVPIAEQASLTASTIWEAAMECCSVCSKCQLRQNSRDWKTATPDDKNRSAIEDWEQISAVIEKHTPSFDMETNKMENILGVFLTRKMLKELIAQNLI